MGLEVKFGATDGVAFEVDATGVEGVEEPVSVDASPVAGDCAGRGTRTEASKRTVRWCANVASPLSVRKKRYCTTMGAVERGVEDREEDFSMRAQVK